MRKTKYLLSLLFICTVLLCNAQNDEDGVRIILKASIGNIKNSSFYVYEPSFKAKAIYKDTIQEENLYPLRKVSRL